MSESESECPEWIEQFRNGDYTVIKPESDAGDSDDRCSPQSEPEDDLATDRCPECGCVADAVLDIRAVGSGGPVAHQGRVCVDRVGGYGSDEDSVWRLYCHGEPAAPGGESIAQETSHSR